MTEIINIIIICLISAIALLHILSTVLSGKLSAVLTYVCIFLHTLLIPPLLLVKAEYETVALIFLISVAFYAVCYTVSSKLIRPRLCRKDGKEDSV